MPSRFGAKRVWQTAVVPPRPLPSEGTHRLEPGDVVEFAVEAYPGAGAGHRKAAAEVRFLSKVRLKAVCNCVGCVRFQTNHVLT